MAQILKSIILGVVQGIAEWLPVSSTAHLLLIDRFMSLQVGEACKKLFLVVVQLGSITSVIVLYFKELWPDSKQKLALWLKILLASIPTGVLGLLFEDYISSKLYSLPVIALTLAFYGVAFIVIERVKKSQGSVYKINSLEEITYPRAFGVGCFQALALIPGTSRSGSTIMGALLLGIARPQAAKFSFFLAIPAMFGAGAYKILKSGFLFNSLEIAVLVCGTITSFVVSLFVLKAFMAFLRSHSFEVFGWYRVILGCVVGILWLLER